MDRVQPTNQIDSSYRHQIDSSFVPSGRVRVFSKFAFNSSVFKVCVRELYFFETVELDVLLDVCASFQIMYLIFPANL